MCWTTLWFWTASDCGAPRFRVPIGRVVFEVGGGGIREEIAKEGTHLAVTPVHTSLILMTFFPALRLASAKLPVQTEFISINSLPRLGATLVNKAAPVTEPTGEIALDGIIEGPADTALPAATLP